MEANMDVIYPRCAGLDVHKETVVACVRIASDGPPEQAVQTYKTTTAGLLALADWLGSFDVKCVAMEATGVYWKPVWHVLEGHFELILANAAHVKNVPGRKTDVNDAMWLADLLAHGLIRAGFVPPVAVQELRTLTRTRKQLVRERSAHVLRIDKVLEDANLKLGSCSPISWARVAVPCCKPSSTGRMILSRWPVTSACESRPAAQKYWKLCVATSAPITASC
jgi:transposase